jgi:GMP synthase (glutamine-hydrolysing)
VRILIVDNTIDRDSWGSGELRDFARLAQSATIHVRRAPARDLPRDLGSFDRIIVSGSKTSVDEEGPWIDALDESLRRAIDLGKPVLGICYGHQALNRALGGKRTVRRAERGEFGWAEIERVDLGGEAAGGSGGAASGSRESALFRGLPRRFHTFEWHRDEVSELAPGMRLIARSAGCSVQACELDGKAAFGVQFHPERGVERGERSLTRKRKEVSPRELLNPGRGKDLFDRSVSERIFRNFLELKGA